jgi:hypothetical protein
MKLRYIIISIAIVLALIISAPVSAYSISVSGGNGNTYVSSKFQSYLDGIQIKKPQSIAGTNSFGSQGSVSAFSKGAFQDQNTFIEFKQMVSVNGNITKFSYSAKYDSGIFR